jgi:RecB family exonuclease
MTLTLSPTAFLTYEDCPRQYHYRYVLKAKPRITAANLVFGDVIHQVLHTYLQGWLQGQAVNPTAEFETLWTQRTQTEALDYPASWSPEALLATGQRLMEQFPAVWDQAGLMPLLDGQGQPLLERRLQAPIASGVILSGKLDCVALDREAQVILLDFKTPAQATGSGLRPTE